MTVEELKKQQSEMPDSQLLELVKKQISKLAATGGKSHRMTVPPRLDDTDMLFSELVRRYEQLSAYASQQREE